MCITWVYAWWRGLVHMHQKMCLSNASENPAANSLGVIYHYTYGLLGSTCHLLFVQTHLDEVFIFFLHLPKWPDTDWVWGKGHNGSMAKDPASLLLPQTSSPQKQTTKNDCRLTQYHHYRDRATKFSLDRIVFFVSQVSWIGLKIYFCTKEYC